MSTSYAILKANITDFCSTCKSGHNEERHKKYFQHKKKYVAKLRVLGKYCSVCVGYHNPIKHQHRLVEDRGRLRDSRPLVGPPPPEFYPYGQTISPLLETVINAVTKNLPEDVRAETCQEMLLAILEGRLNLDESSNRAEEFIQATYRTLYQGWKIRSVDDFAFTNSTDSKLTLREILPDNSLLCEDCGAPTYFGECTLCLTA